MFKLAYFAAAALSIAVTSAAAQPTSGQVSGQVFVEASMKPLAGAQVSVGNRQACTTSDGRFTLQSVPLGSQTVVVTHDGFVPVTQVITVAPGQTVTMELRLLPQPAIAEAVTVIGRLSDYVESTAGASRTSARLIDIPQAIVVLPAQFLSDLGALDTKDLYKHISGVSDSPYSQLTPRLRLVARLDNVFDRQYAASSLFAARAGNYPGQPRTFSIALTVTSQRAPAALAPRK